MRVNRDNGGKKWLTETRVMLLCKIRSKLQLGCMFINSGHKTGLCGHALDITCLIYMRHRILSILPKYSVIQRENQYFINKIMEGIIAFIPECSQQNKFQDAEHWAEKWQIIKYYCKHFAMKQRNMYSCNNSKRIDINKLRRSSGYSQRDKTLGRHKKGCMSSKHFESLFLQLQD